MCAWWPDLEQLALKISRRVEIEQRSLRILAPPLEYRIVQDPRDEDFGVVFERSGPGNFDNFGLRLSSVFRFVEQEPLDPGAESAPELRLRMMLTNTATIHKIFSDFDERRWRDLYWYAEGHSAFYAQQCITPCYGC